MGGLLPVDPGSVEKGDKEFPIPLTGRDLKAMLVKKAIAFHDFITDPPMTQRERTRQSIADARAEARKRHLLRRY